MEVDDGQSAERGSAVTSFESASSEGVSARQAAVRFGVGISTAIRWIGRARIGERTARPQGWRRGSTLDPHEAFIVTMIEKQKDVTLDEMVTRLATQVDLSIGRSALSVWLRRRGWTFKKNRTRIGAGAR